MSQLTLQQVDDLADWLDGVLFKDTSLTRQHQVALLSLTYRYRMARIVDDHNDELAGLVWVITRIGFVYAGWPGYIHAWRPDGW